jgi:hypothetical protein
MHVARADVIGNMYAYSVETRSIYGWLTNLIKGDHKIIRQRCYVKMDEDAVIWINL